MFVTSLRKILAHRQALLEAVERHFQQSPHGFAQMSFGSKRRGVAEHDASDAQQPAPLLVIPLGKMRLIQANQQLHSRRRAD